MDNHYKEIDPFEEYFPGESLKARCQRQFRRIISVDPNGYRTRSNLKSLTVIKAETLRHLLFYRNKIHCYSRLRFFWEFFMILTYGIAYTVIPYQVAFLYHYNQNSNSICLALTRAVDVICLIDIAINFLSSYQDHRTGNIVLKGSRIARHYIQGYFWIDFISTIPDIVSWIWNIHDHRSINLTDSYWDLIAILSLLKFLQLPLFFQYLVNYLQQRNNSDYYITFIRNTLTIAFCFHLIVCLNFLIIRIIFTPLGSNSNPLVVDSTVDTSFWSETNNAEKYGVIVYAVTHTLTLFASMVEEKNLIDMTFAFCLTIVGFILHIWLIAKVYLYLRASYGPSYRFQELRYQLKEYVAFKHVPKHTRKRILAFYDFSYNGNFFRKKEIDGLLSSDLKHMIVKETIEKLLKQHHLFMLLPSNLLHSIAIAMSEEVFLRNDVICRNDRTRGQKLFIIVHGTVAAYTTDGEEVVHLSDGSIFGETEFLNYGRNLPSPMNYVAVEESTIAVLNRSDFMRIMAENSDYVDEMRRYLRINENSQTMTKENVVKFAV